jgi:hypothetical protein
MRCILHIGMHKTGTTSIQRSLADFADDAFVYYADHLERSNHGRAVYEWLGIEQWDVRRANFHRARTQLRHVIRALQGRTLIVSSERIWRMPQGLLARLAGFLRARGFDKIEIAAYIRPPAAYLTSVAQQHAKTNGHIDFPTLIAKEYADYEARFGTIDAVFGRENVHLKKFDPASFEAGCVVRDFCHQFGIDIPESRVERVNESLSREALGLLFTYRRLSPDSATKRDGIAAQLGTIGKTKFRLSPDLLRQTLAAHRDDIEWMEARLGCSLQENLGDAQPNDISSAADLLRPDPATIAELRGVLGDRAAPGMTGETPEQVAKLVHALRDTG